MENERASSGHKLGQLIGDWYEEYFVLPLLQDAANSLELYVDSRFIERTCRESAKIIWKDIDGNSVDFDYVLELDGTDTIFGVPVAFIECFWRRGERHSKDKARDDSGKLMPMRDTYPTARFLGIVSAGNFTEPARELVKSRGIDLFYVPKNKIIESFYSCGLTIDYPDRANENEKSSIVAAFEEQFCESKKLDVRRALIDLIGIASIKSYVSRVNSYLSALPQEIRFILRQDSMPIIFKSIHSASEFLTNPNFNMAAPVESYVYQITYSDGTEFSKAVESIESLQNLHQQITLLAQHMNKISAKPSVII